ncbi:TPA: ERF family protein [Streptococcus suis]|uniref:ERF family protein n=1 Tax=Streptococcus suis TaxID=1307 RepID=UPI001478257D|nr:ERF family protein [Streptococcus suis]MBS7951714.1 single-stranded DNA-binding protein [Streptococcus suis]MBS7979736.1 single-stranded DNA-binding protein [Streptococcus suis]HEM2987975.1 ERF family protein [Streptococcus suis]HEM6544403.1 ERF family protein [Streptococcus suis]HEM6568962.1 ERF family protein [Streptococcus suis]
MADLTFSEVQEKMQIAKSAKKGISYSFRTAEEINTKFKELKSGWVLNISYELYEIMGRLFVKAIATATKGDEVHSSTAYSEHDEVPVFKNGNKQMEPPKWTGAVSSYAGKYALQGLFAIGEKDVDEYPSEENQQQQDQNNQQNQVKYIDNIQYQEILKTVEEFATVKGAPFDTVANFVLNKYQIQDFHQVPVDGYNVVMEYLNAQIQKAYSKQGE